MKTIPAAGGLILALLTLTACAHGGSKPPPATHTAAAFSPGLWRIEAVTADGPAPTVMECLTDQSALTALLLKAAATAEPCKVSHEATAGGAINLAAACAKGEDRLSVNVKGTYGPAEFAVRTDMSVTLDGAPPTPIGFITRGQRVAATCV